MSDQHQHRATPEQWAKTERMESGGSATSSCLLELRDLVKSVRDSALHLALVTSKLGHRVEALEATQHAHIEAKAAEAGARCAVEQLRSKPGEWQPIRTFTADEVAPIVVPTANPTPAAVSPRLTPEDLGDYAYSDPIAGNALRAGCTQAELIHYLLFNRANLLKQLCDAKAREMPGPVKVGGNVYVYKASAADARQLTLVERVALAINPRPDESPTLYGDEARAAIREVAAWLQENPGPNSAWPAVARDLMYEASPYA